MKSTILTLVLLLGFVILQGCGQSGPLYIPGDPSAVETPPPPADEDDNEENGEDDSR